MLTLHRKQQVEVFLFFIPVQLIYCLRYAPTLHVVSQQEFEVCFESFIGDNHATIALPMATQCPRRSKRGVGHKPKLKGLVCFLFFNIVFCMWRKQPFYAHEITAG